MEVPILQWLLNGLTISDLYSAPDMKQLMSYMCLSMVLWIMEKLLANLCLLCLW